MNLIPGSEKMCWHSDPLKKGGCKGISVMCLWGFVIELRCVNNEELTRLKSG